MLGRSILLSSMAEWHSPERADNHGDENHALAVRRSSGAWAVWTLGVGSLPIQHTGSQPEVRDRSGPEFTEERVRIGEALWRDPVSWRLATTLAVASAPNGPRPRDLAVRSEAAVPVPPRAMPSHCS